jgi:hypothetical protein
MKNYLVGGPLNGMEVEIPAHMIRTNRLGIMFKAKASDWKPDQVAVYELGDNGVTGFRYFTPVAGEYPAIATALVPRWPVDDATPNSSLYLQTWSRGGRYVGAGSEAEAPPAAQDAPTAAPEPRPWPTPAEPATLPAAKPWGRPAN